jgi:WD40 repeat protein
MGPLAAGDPRQVGTRTAHLLGTTDPARAVIDVLHSRVSGDLEWGVQAVALRDRCPRPRLVNHQPPPDLPDPALRRVLIGHTGAANAVAIAPGRGLLATASDDGTVRIWNAATGGTLAVLTGHRGPVRALAIAPDGGWLATVGQDYTMRTWDAMTDQQRAAIRVPASLPYDGVNGVAIAPGGG